jgi:hypothetical protein
MPSVGINNARFGQFVKVYKWLKNQRLTFFFDDMIAQVTADFDMHRSSTMRAFRFDGHRQRFFSQAPLHEGRRNRVFRSGGIDTFTSTEGQIMGGLVNRHRIRPGNHALGVPEQKRQMLLQVIQDSVHPAGWQIHMLCDVLYRQRLSYPREFSHYKIADQVMFP